MKIIKSQLKKIIKEEIVKLAEEKEGKGCAKKTGCIKQDDKGWFIWNNKKGGIFKRCSSKKDCEKILSVPGVHEDLNRGYGLEEEAGKLPPEVEKHANAQLAKMTPEKFAAMMEDDDTRAAVEEIVAAATAGLDEGFLTPGASDVADVASVTAGGAMAATPVAIYAAMGGAGSTLATIMGGTAVGAALAVTGAGAAAGLGLALAAYLMSKNPRK